MRSWTARHWLWAAAGTVAAAMATGIPTALVPNPFFARGVAAPWWAYPVWIASAVLSGLLIATYAADGSRAEHRRSDRRSITGAVLSFLAVGCPTCNKLVLVALGTNGALTWFGPVQPVLAVGSLLLLGLALRARLRADRSRPSPSAARPDPRRAAARGAVPTHRSRPG